MTMYGENVNVEVKDGKAHYQISQYAPQVEGTIFLGQYK